MHDLTQYAEAEIMDRLEGLYDTPYLVILCGCDDFEVDDGYLIRKCPWNDMNALEAELTRRELESMR